MAKKVKAKGRVAKDPMAKSTPNAWTKGSLKGPKGCSAK